MGQLDAPLKHFPFFEALAAMDDTDPTWREISAGLVVMRLVDVIVERMSTDARKSWQMAAVREAVELVSPGRPAQRILSGIVDLAQGMDPGSHADASGSAVAPPRVTIAPMVPRLMAYAQSLEYDGRWLLAADVYRTIIEQTDPVAETDLAIPAHLQLAFCLWNVDAWDAAADAYVAAGEVARAANDPVGVLRARMGEGRIAISRGNLPLAEAIFDETIARAEAASLSDVHSRALHNRASVAGMREQYDAAVQLAFEALSCASSQRERDRILGDVATGFLHLGQLDVARDGYLVLIHTAQEQYVRWTATINLIEVAARQGSAQAFDDLRATLAAVELPAHLEGRYLITVAIGYGVLGRAEEALAYFARAMTHATAHRLNSLYFEAEEGAREIRAQRPHRFDPATPLSDALAPVASAIRVLKAGAGV